MSERASDVIGWTLVATAAALGLRIMYLWNRISPSLAHGIVGKAVDWFL